MNLKKKISLILLLALICGLFSSCIIIGGEGTYTNRYYYTAEMTTTDYKVKVGVIDNINTGFNFYPNNYQYKYNDGLGFRNVNHQYFSDYDLKKYFKQYITNVDQVDAMINKIKYEKHIRIDFCIGETVLSISK